MEHPPIDCCHHEVIRFTQVVVDGKLVIPANKPDIERVLHITTKPVITKNIVIDGKIIFYGYLEIWVEYVALVKGNRQPVYFSSFQAPFQGFIDHPYAKRNMLARLTLGIEFQEFRVINSRLMSMMIIIKVCAVSIEPSGYWPGPIPCPSEHIASEYPSSEADSIHNAGSPETNICPLCGKSHNQ